MSTTPDYDPDSYIADTGVHLVKRGATAHVLVTADAENLPTLYYLTHSTTRVTFGELSRQQASIQLVAWGVYPVPPGTVLDRAERNARRNREAGRDGVGTYKVDL